MIRMMMAAAALAASAAAQADVVYEWQQLTTGQAEGQTRGELRITDAAFAAGSIDYRHTTQTTQRPENANPNSPVISFLFGVENNPLAARLAPLTTQVLGGSLNLVLGADSVLSGRIDITGDPAGAVLSGSGGLWSLTGFISDIAGTCGNLTGFSSLPDCAATGRWVLDAATVPDGVGQVPVPGILPLMALASVGLGLSLRRKHARDRDA